MSNINFGPCKVTKNVTAVDGTVHEVQGTPLFDDFNRRIFYGDVLLYYRKTGPTAMGVVHMNEFAETRVRNLYNNGEEDMALWNVSGRTMYGCAILGHILGNEEDWHDNARDLVSEEYSRLYRCCDMEESLEEGLYADFIDIDTKKAL